MLFTMMTSFIIYLYILCQQGFCLIQCAGGVISCLCQVLCCLFLAAQHSGVWMGQCKSSVRKIIAYELFYLVLQNQEGVWFSGSGYFSWIDLFLRMQQWWVSVKIRKAVFWGNETDVSSVLALLKRFMMAGFFFFFLG